MQVSVWYTSLSGKSW